jgi:hypothetical protein
MDTVRDYAVFTVFAIRIERKICPVGAFTIRCRIREEYVADRQPDHRTGVINTGRMPDRALLRRYLDAGAYTDCYVTEIRAVVTLPDFVEAFYTTPLFKIERAILATLVARPSTDKEARALADGELSSFAAWNVEGREPDQLLLADYRGRTRSWLMTVPAAHKGNTCLYFGSAVVPLTDRRTGKAKTGGGFNLLLGFHRGYSRALLRAACRRLARLVERRG